LSIVLDCLNLGGTQPINDKLAKVWIKSILKYLKDFNKNIIYAKYLVQLILKDILNNMEVLTSLKDFYFTYISQILEYVNIK